RRCSQATPVWTVTQVPGGKVLADQRADLLATVEVPDLDLPRGRAFLVLRGHVLRTRGDGELLAVGTESCCEQVTTRLRQRANLTPGRHIPDNYLAVPDRYSLGHLHQHWDPHHHGDAVGLVHSLAVPEDLAFALLKLGNLLRFRPDDLSLHVTLAEGSETAA